ncbi:hypothetical protein D3C79_1021520 [compost metagenome]
MIFRLIGSRYKMTFITLFDRYYLFLQTNIGLEQLHLPGEVVYQLLSSDFRETSHIIDVFLRIKCGELPAQLGHAFN